MSRTVTTALAGAVVSLLTLPGPAPVAAAPFGEAPAAGTAKSPAAGSAEATVSEVARIIDEAAEAAKVPGSVFAGTITEDITRAWVRDDNGDPVLKDGEPIDDRGAESTLGNLVADALTAGVEDSQLAPADFGITNPGGLRTDLLCEDIVNDEERCEVTAAELSGVLPFADDHGVVTMKGADVIGLFEEQWQPADASRPFLHLGVSEELDVVYDSTAEAGQRVKSVTVDGEEIDPGRDYRVATLSFLAAGGDNFSSFATGEFELSGRTDVETWIDCFNDNSPVAPDTSERQADLAHDVIADGTLTVDVDAPAGRIEPGKSADFLLRTDAEAEVRGPIDVDLELPEGYSATVPSLTLDSIPAGESVHTVRVTAPADASGEATVTVSLRAGESQWWDDNPLPIAHEFSATAVVAAGPGADAAAGASGGADGAADGADAGGPVAGTADASGTVDTADGAGSGAGGGGSGSDSSSGSGADAGASADGVTADLPRTGFELMRTLAAALALIVAGSAALGMARRRTSLRR